MASERFVVREIDGDEQYRSELIDTQTGDQVGSDGGEPEDRYFSRDWSWVPALLNKLDAERVAAVQDRDTLTGMLAKAQAELVVLRAMRDE